MPTSNRQSQGVYIFRNSTILYFRQVVPADLRPAIQRREFRISLRTPDRKLAKRHAAYLSARIWDIFSALRKGDRRMTELKSEQIQELVQKWAEEILSQDEAGRALARPTEPHGEEVETFGVNDYIESEAREALGTNNYRLFKNGAMDILEENGLTAAPDSIEFKTLCREMIKAQIEICKVIKDRDRGIYPTTYTADASPNLYSGSVQKSNASKAQKTLISAAFKAYVDDKKAHGNWTASTGKSIADKVNVFIELLGDIKLCDITQSKLKAVETMLIKFPKNKNKSPKYRDLTIAEIKKLDIPEGDRMSLTTVNNYINQINGFLSWVKTMYELPDWLNVVMSTPRGDIMADTRKSKAVFSTEDLHKIFYNRWYVTGGRGMTGLGRKRPQDGAKFWLPLMALFSGARLEELAQLYLSDFKIIDGVKCFELIEVIEDEEGNQIKAKSIKNAASRRVVPIHDTLLNLGLWEYVQELKAAGKQRLFEELKKNTATGKYSHDFSKSYNRHLKDFVGIQGDAKEGSKVFYSYRHTFINYCVQHRIPDALFERVVGHKVEGNQITYSHYAKALSPKILKADVLDKIDYGISFEHLKKNPFARERKE